VGSDADIAIWDPKKKVKLTHMLLKDASDYTPYEGLNVTGWPELTMVRADVS
jgi:dihydropyrimidinase